MVLSRSRRWQGASSARGVHTLPCPHPPFPPRRSSIQASTIIILSYPQARPPCRPPCFVSIRLVRQFHSRSVFHPSVLFHMSRSDKANLLSMQHITGHSLMTSYLCSAAIKLELFCPFRILDIILPKNSLADYIFRRSWSLCAHSAATASTVSSFLTRFFLEYIFQQQGRQAPAPHTCNSSAVLYTNHAPAADTMHQAALPISSFPTRTSSKVRLANHFLAVANLNLKLFQCCSRCHAMLDVQGKSVRVLILLKFCDLANRLFRMSLSRPLPQPTVQSLKDSQRLFAILVPAHRCFRTPLLLSHARSLARSHGCKGSSFHGMGGICLCRRF